MTLFSIDSEEADTLNRWTVLSSSCNIDDEDDFLVNNIVDLIRRSYGENKILTDAKKLQSIQELSETFDFEKLLNALRDGFPNPDLEGRKPTQLTNYRSQSAEMVAKLVLGEMYNFEYPTAPQEGVLNSNQPILGFDGWGIYNNDGVVHLVFIQVKATDVSKSPPDDAKKLARECCIASQDKSKICRALGVMASHTRGDPIQAKLIIMLEKLGKNEEIPLVISPAIIRGVTKSRTSDLNPIKEIRNIVNPISIFAISVSIGTNLETFGYHVMNKARGSI